jgi:uncharacterized protein YdiU (UPF0061 family)
VEAQNFLALPHTTSARDLALALLDAVVQRTASLMAQWQSVGFCHGVMNTDNMSLLGLTLDYGPFQFMDGYHPGHICNHSDHQGRYAFDQQPRIAHWNLYCLGQALMPVIDDVQATVDVLDTYTPRYEHAWGERLARKLGLPTMASTTSLGTQFLNLLARQQADHTVAWRSLSNAVRDWSGRLDDGVVFAELGQQVGAGNDWDSWLRDFLHSLQSSLSSTPRQPAGPRHAF